MPKVEAILAALSRIRLSFNMSLPTNRPPQATLDYCVYIMCMHVAVCVCVCVCVCACILQCMCVTKVKGMHIHVPLPMHCVPVLPASCLSSRVYYCNVSHALVVLHDVVCIFRTLVDVFYAVG